MTTVDDLWFLADEADQAAEQAYHDLRADHADFIENEHDRTVSRQYFRTLAQRVVDSGAPFGAHTLVYRDGGELLLCRDGEVDQWVLPGGEVDGGECFRSAAERELAEEAGVTVDYDGLAILTRVNIRSGAYGTWGVMPIFAAEAVSTDPCVEDPDGEIVDARWFADLPEDTRDREDLVDWRERRFGN